jgi:hypothetical protein
MASSRYYTREEVLDYIQEEEDGFGLEESEEEEFDGLAAYRGDSIVSESLLIDSEDISDALWDNQSNCCSSQESLGTESSCDEHENPSAQQGKKRKRVESATTKRQPKKSLMEPVTGKWLKAETQALTWPYKLKPGPKIDMPDDAQADDYFSLVFDERVWDLLVTETNRYQHQTISDPEHSRPWEDVTVEEMKAFIGILMLMGILKLPRLELYWQQAHPLIQQHGIPEVMTLVRFQQIWRFLHLANSDNQVPVGTSGYDKLFKVRPLLDLIQPNLEAIYTMHEHICVDEAMIRFKGRLSFRQYMKAKPTKWGVKVFVLCDSTNGYIFRFQIYTGKAAESIDVTLGLCSRSVVDLLQGLEENHHKLYTDNYYTSPKLYLHLYKMEVNACGTVRTNRRGFPKQLVVPQKEVNKRDRGYYDYRANGPLLAVAWKDRKMVYFVSTAHVALHWVVTYLQLVDMDHLERSCIFPVRPCMMTI